MVVALDDVLLDFRRLEGDYGCNLANWWAGGKDIDGKDVIVGDG